MRGLKITKKTSVAKKKTKSYLAPSKNVILASGPNVEKILSPNMVILYINRKLMMSWLLFNKELGSENVMEKSY